MSQSRNDESASPIDYDEYSLSDLSRFENPFGLETHEFYRIWFGIAHLSAAYYFYLVLFGIISVGSLIPCVIMAFSAGYGINVGGHRYWSHKTFKANTPLRLLFMVLQTFGFQDTIFKWCRSHRVHHKFTGTNADPVNASRGFWYSHLTWLMLPRHPDVQAAYKKIEVSDLANDPIVRFQAKYYPELILIIFFLVPMAIFKLLYPDWDSLTVFSANSTRYMFSLHTTFFVNSLAHMYGYKSYDKFNNSMENFFVSFLAIGEGWHNYHHTFPWDYRSSEYGSKMNTSTLFIQFFALIGWAYDLKTVNEKLLIERIKRTGDGTHPIHGRSGRIEDKIGKDEGGRSWGWGDNTITKEDIVITQIDFGRS